METEFSTMQQLKRRMYAMRNGIVADALRKAGCPHRIVFGLNLPQLTEIAAEFGPSEELAEALWADEALRESVLLAPMLYPAEKLDYDKALRLANGAKWSEDADILCFKLLRKAPFAARLAGELCRRPEQMSRYAGLRLFFNLVGTNAAEALAAADAELGRSDALSGIASMLKEEAEFLIG